MHVAAAIILGSHKLIHKAWRGYVKSKILNVALLLIGAAFGVNALASEPLDNVALPNGTYGLLYPIYYSSDKAIGNTGNSITSGIGLRVAANIFRVTKAWESSNGAPYQLTALVPIKNVEGFGRRDHGLGDITLGAAKWVVNNPDTQTWLAFATFIDIPTGHFDKNNPASVGSNVWRISPTIGLAKMMGPVDLEVTLRFNMYSKNHETGITPGNQFALENYIGIFVAKNILVGAHYNTLLGQDGRDTTGRLSNSAVEMQQFGASMNWSYTATAGVTFEILRDQYVRNGPQGNLALLRFYWKM